MKTDFELQNIGIDELQREPGNKTAEVGVTGRVMAQSGHADSYHQKWVAGRVASRVLGVEEVAGKINTGSLGSLKWSDKDIARMISTDIRSNVSVPPDCIKVHVQDGLVTLTGEIGWEYQKFAASETVHYLMGVASVINKITVKQKVKS